MLFGAGQNSDISICVKGESVFSVLLLFNLDREVGLVINWKDWLRYNCALSTPLCTAPYIDMYVKFIAIASTNTYEGKYRMGDKYHSCIRRSDINMFQKLRGIQIPNKNRIYSCINKSRCHVFPWMTVGSLHSLLSFFRLTGRTDSRWIRCHPELPTRNQNWSNCTDLIKDKQASMGYDKWAGKSCALSIPPKCAHECNCWRVPSCPYKCTL